MEASCEDSHQIYFPETASWDQKILLLMMCQMIEIEFCDRVAQCPGC